MPKLDDCIVQPPMCETSDITVEDFIPPGQWNLSYWNETENHMIIIGVCLLKPTRFCDVEIPDYYKHLKLKPLRASKIQ